MSRKIIKIYPKWVDQLRSFLSNSSSEEFNTIWKETEEFQNIGPTIEESNLHEKIYIIKRRRRRNRRK